MINSSDILGAKILIVDDQKANVLLLERMLRDASYACIASTMDPLEVCALHRKNRYDLILLDLHLPDLSGIQVLNRLKSDARTASIPVVVLTADALPGTEAQVREAGAVGCLSKPVDVPKFLDTITLVLEESKEKRVTQ